MSDIEQRTRSLIRLSDNVYWRGRREELNGQERATRIVRMGMQITAQMLEAGYGDGLVAGDRLQKYLFDTLGIHRALSEWSEYQRHFESLAPVRRPKLDRQLGRIASLYATTTRKTINLDGSFETDGLHVTHTMALALPYAAKYYPDLDLSKIAVYTLFHDIRETFAKDTSSLGRDTATEREVLHKEAASWQRIKEAIGDRYPRLIRMNESYEELADDEARYTKMYDKLDPKFNTLYTFGRSLTRHHNLSAEKYRLLMSEEAETMAISYGRDFPDLIGIQQELVRQIIAVTDWQK